MPTYQKLLLAVGSGTMIAFGVSGGSALIYVENLFASLPFIA